jgi:hypothetical protein
MSSSPLFSQIELLPIAYVLVVLCVSTVGVIAHFCASQLIRKAPAWLAKLLSTPLGLHVSGEDFFERLFDPGILLNLHRMLIPGLVLPAKIVTQVAKLCPQRDGTINMREQVLAGKYWSGTQPREAA